MMGIKKYSFIEVMQLEPSVMMDLRAQPPVGGHARGMEELESGHMDQENNFYVELVNMNLSN
jgi:hypothetical protein